MCIRDRGISGHADRDHLTAWIANFKKPPKKVFIVHGEETTAVEFAEHVKNDVGFDALAPYSGDAYDLLTGEPVSYTHLDVYKIQRI